MAHECPICYMRCHCGGDIDSCEYEGTPEQLNCTHCNEDDWDDDYDDEDEFYENNYDDNGKLKL